MKGSLNAIIVDDELPARENLKWMLGDACPEVKVVGTADGIENGLALFNDKKPDLVFLDIRMPSGSEGFDLLKLLKGHPFHAVFVTAFKDYAIRAFENRALHYILKPIDYDDLVECVERIKQRHQLDNENPSEYEQYKESLVKLEDEIQKSTQAKRISIHHSKGIKLVDPNDILYLEANGNCTIIHFDDGGQYLDTRTLKIYEALVPVQFFRTHKSFMVNLHKVDEILHGNEQSAVLKGGKHIPISRERKKNLLLEISKLG